MRRMKMWLVKQQENRNSVKRQMEVKTLQQNSDCQKLQCGLVMKYISID